MPMNVGPSRWFMIIVCICMIPKFAYYWIRYKLTGKEMDE